MAHYILEFQGADPRQADIALIEESAEVTILDRIGGAFLVDASEQAARLLRDQLPDWTVEPETTYPPPETA